MRSARRHDQAGGRRGRDCNVAGCEAVGEPILGAHTKVSVFVPAHCSKLRAPASQDHLAARAHIVPRAGERRALAHIRSAPHLDAPILCQKHSVRPTSIHLSHPCRWPKDRKRPWDGHVRGRLALQGAALSPACDPGSAPRFMGVWSAALLCTWTTH